MLILISVDTALTPCLFVPNEPIAKVGSTEEVFQRLHMCTRLYCKILNSSPVTPSFRKVWLRALADHLKSNFRSW